MTLVLDAGALIAHERRDRRMALLLEHDRLAAGRLLVPAGVVGQVWRDGRRQARLAALLGAEELTVVALDDRGSRAAGQLCGVTRTADVIDASVVLCAQAYGGPIVTSDPDDLRRLDATVRLLTV